MNSRQMSNKLKKLEEKHLGSDTQTIIFCYLSTSNGSDVIMEKLYPDSRMNIPTTRYTKKQDLPEIIEFIEQEVIAKDRMIIVDDIPLPEDTTDIMAGASGLWLDLLEAINQRNW